MPSRDFNKIGKENLYLDQVNACWLQRQAHQRFADRECSNTLAPYRPLLAKFSIYHVAQVDIQPLYVTGHICHTWDIVKT